ncbi:MAG: aminotransferase class I/II-fold pyridoxal phosphate-dependent enzyme [Legionellaceae bacterium]|nr:aminotransferase class I/II-fold pyridoxal phosphate-dependent enzyme [Legionellaceae bacterium]
MSNHLTLKLQQYAALRDEQGLHRQRHIVSADKHVIHFSSNDYLSLAHDDRVRRAYQIGFATHPVGSGGSMVVCGYHAAHRTLEKAFAQALQVDDCLLFSSGYAANLSVVSLLAQMDASLLIDKAVHASIYDGLKLSGAKYQRYLHNDVIDLAKKMDDQSSNTVVMTESVFSMSGQRAPLADIAQLTNVAQIDLLVDEAHAFGVFGPEGLGGVMESRLTQMDVPLRVIPFGKAVGASGAIVAGQGVWIDALLQMRPAVYSTSISPAYSYGLLETLDIIRQADARREKLAHLVHYFREAIQRSPLKWRDSCSPIQQLQLGCPHKATTMAANLREHAIICLPMRQPTVNRDETGLRVILNYHHEPEQIDLLFHCLHASG